MNAGAPASATLIAGALEAGFSHAVMLDIATLVPRPEVRDMCAANRCGMYGACWTCPPHCGTLAACGARMRAYSSGLLVQTVATLADDFDYPGMLEAERRHQATFRALQERLSQTYPGLLALGAGGCRLCARCACPDAPCRFPEKATLSLEAYGLLVSEVCRDNGLSYYYGAGTVSYTGCYLFD